MMEMNAQWAVFSGLLIGSVAANLEYGLCVTPQMRFRCSMKYSALMCLFSIPYTYFICPVCQWPNRGEMQVVPMEMRFKNFIDQKYHWYDNADRHFYDTLTSDKKLD